MNVEEIRDYCLSLRNTTECFPFDDVCLVFKIEGKMYGLIPLDEAEPQIFVKCHTDHVEELRDQYEAVIPAFHFNKKYWNTIFGERDMKDDEIKKWIRHSYRQVIAKLPKKIRDTYEND